MFFALFGLLSAVAGTDTLVPAESDSSAIEHACSADSFASLEKTLIASGEKAGYSHTVTEVGTVRSSSALTVPLKLSANKEHRVFVISDGSLDGSFITPDGSEFPLSDLTGPELGGLKGMLGGIAGLPEPLDFTLKVKTTDSGAHKVRVLHFVK